MFQKGDVFYNTGDLLKLHANKWLSFADRLGDTYRWKGENVSTMQVGFVVNSFYSVLDSNVYGVSVPFVEGRAGMVTMSVAANFSLTEFEQYLVSELSVHQIPYFLRITNQLQTTGTFKHQKEAFKSLGFDPKNFSEPVYFLDQDRYVVMTSSLYDEIQLGKKSF